MKKMYYVLILVVVLVFVGVTGFAYSATVQVSWAANTESDIAGYKLYCGTTSGSYPYVYDVGLVTSKTLSGLSNGANYYFAVTAYDTSGNESVFSQEIHILIPADASPGSGDTGSSTDTDFDGIPDSVEASWGLDPAYALDALEDADGDGFINLVEYMAGTSPVNVSEHPANDNILKDIIASAGDAVDLSSLNPQGAYEIVSLDGSYPEPMNNMLTVDDPGSYLYNIYDGNGTLVYCVRISVTDKLSSNETYAPGSVLNLIDQALGIQIQIPDNAQTRSIPIGIGGTGSGTPSAQNGSFQFDILPFGLVLAKPAVVTVNCKGSNPSVQRYDVDNNSWVDVENVSSSEGKVSFSASQLGTFRVVSDKATGSSSSGGGGGGGGGGCFISTAGL
jgi:hypothetical protein